MKIIGITMFMLLLVFVAFGQTRFKNDMDRNNALMETDLVGYEVRLYWKDSSGVIYRDFRRVRNEADTMLVSLCNGGMFMEGYIPMGLYVEDGKVLRPVNRRQGTTNFYMEPNGIFLVCDDGACGIIRTVEYEGAKGIRYATQSGPILVEDSVINPKFNRESTYTNRRNGVGIRKDGSVVLLISFQWVNFYDFAEFFRAEGCVDALYLDGAISCLWYGEMDYGDPTGFGVMIGIRKK